MTDHASDQLHRMLQFHAEARRTLGPGLLPGFKYVCMEEYVLREGRDYESQPLTKAERAWFDSVTRGVRYPIKECFSNSQQLLINAHEIGIPGGWDLFYVEGYVVVADLPIPIHHGWLSLNGKVIDVTLRVRGATPTRRDRFHDRAIGTFEGRAYRGVAFGVNEIRRYVARARAWASVIDNYRDGFPLLRGVRLNEEG